MPRADSFIVSHIGMASAYASACEQDATAGIQPQLASIY
jgi:hypothetical protein